MANQMQNEAECPICLETLKKPIRMLNCGHNFCQGCLHELITSTQQNRCPVCQRDIDSNVSSEEFPRNRMVENLIENMDNISVTSTQNVIQEVRVLSGDAVEQLKDLAKSYEQNNKFNEAVNTWRIIIGHYQPLKQLLPLVSMIGCLLKIGELDEAVLSSVELVSLLESTADQIQPIIDECDAGIHNLVEKFLEYKKFNVIFQLLWCRFNLLKRHYNGGAMLIRMVHISFLIADVAEVVRSPEEIKLFAKQYEFLDDILLFMQNSPATNVAHEIKCEELASFIHNYGFCCNEMNDYLKAIMLFNQAIALRKLAFGDESNDYKDFAHSYNNMGHALEYSNHLLEAKTAYQTSIEIYKQSLDYEKEKEKDESISLAKNSLQRLENKLKINSLNQKINYFKSNFFNFFVAFYIKFKTIMESW